jgi:hypothetical protein
LSVKLTFTLRKFKTRAAGRPAQPRQLPSSARTPGIHPEKPYATSFSSIQRAPFSIHIRWTVCIRRGRLKGREGGAGRRPAYASVIGPVAASSGLSRFSLRFLLPRNGHKGLHHMPGSVLGSFLMLFAVGSLSSPVELHCIASSAAAPLHSQITPNTFRVADTLHSSSRMHVDLHFTSGV